MRRLIILLCLLFSQLLFSQPKAKDYLFGFSLQNAKIDSSLNTDLYYFFDDYDESIPLKSISFDLNKDGNNEKFIPNDALCGTGGCPWIIYEVNEQKLIGKVSGGVIYINQKIINGYYEVETYWRNGADGGTVTIYEYSNGNYIKSGTTVLNAEESQRYFENK